MLHGGRDSSAKAVLTIGHSKHDLKALQKSTRPSKNTLQNKLLMENLKNNTVTTKYSTLLEIYSMMLKLKMSDTISKEAKEGL